MTVLLTQIDRLNASLARLQRAIEPILEMRENTANNEQTNREEILALLEDRSQLADELDQALAREAELQELADEASEALGAAIDEVRIVMSQTMSKATHR